MQTRQKRRWWQFGTGTLLLVTLVCGAAAWLFEAWVLRPLEREQRIIAEIRQQGGRVTTEALGPEWLDWIDRRYRQRAVAVHLVGPTADDDLLAKVEALEHLRKLWLVETATSPEAASRLQQVRPQVEVRVVQGFPVPRTTDR